MKPPISQLDQDAIIAAVQAGYQALPPEALERLSTLADLQGGFPFDWNWGDDALRVVWADITIAVVPYALVTRASATSLEN